MTDLVVSDLTTSLSQEFTLEHTKRYSIGSINPHLIVVGLPSGNIKLDILSNGVSIASKTFSATDIQTSFDSISDDFRCYYPVIFDNPVQLDGGDYIVKIEKDTYTYSSSGYISWVHKNETGYPREFRLKILEN